MKNQFITISLCTFVVMINIYAMETPEVTEEQNSSEQSSEIVEETKNVVSASVLVRAMRGAKVCEDDTYAIIVERLVMQRADVNWQAGNGYAALHCAIENPCIGTKTIKALCENRADLTMCCDGTRTPLDLACDRGDIAKIKALLTIAENQSELDSF